MSNIIAIPLNKLTRSARNVPKSGGDSIDDLATSILVHGLIHNLTVVEQLADKGWRTEAIKANFGSTVTMRHSNRDRLAWTLAPSFSPGSERQYDRVEISPHWCELLLGN
jgi:hypothetical protein